jgi:UTP--glucose-1-phosphate uridylyltransferase
MISSPCPVRIAVFPVAGLGTRFLPATKVMPKEMLPVVDKPVIQYAVEEAREAGIEQFIFVTGRGKSIISDHFEHADELEKQLRERGKTAELESLLESLLPSGSVSLALQQEPLGLGHAVWCARELAGNEPFAVLLPDDLMVGNPGALKQMVQSYAEIGGGILVAAEEKTRDETNRYGVVDPGMAKGNIIEVRGIVEKPEPENAPSTLCVVGRYILPAEIFRALDKQERGAGGEIQLTDAMARLLGKVPFHAVKTVSRRFDCGDKIGFLHANLAVGLERPDIAPRLKEILAKLKTD